MIMKILKDKRGDGYIDYVVGLLCLMMVVAFVVQLMPVFTVKQQLDVFATEIVREAEIQGNTSLTSRVNELKNQTGLDPTISWSCDYYSGTKVQLNGNISVTLTETVDIGFFVFGSFPIELQAKATGKSEVYYK
ncbi:MAG: DUF4320 family protein [Lachnospiraceae bacterium]